MRPLAEHIATTDRRLGPGAADLLRSVGLLADGPATWGSPIRSNRAGVYVIELPKPLVAAPIDINAVGRWLERVPELRLDGAHPTGRELAARLHGFWLPDQSVVYVGMSTLSVGARVAAYLRTPLGERKPHAGGYWLKTLSGLERLRIWWADTSAAEEYEDALLSEFASKIPPEMAAVLHDPSVVLPFANLQTVEGTRKNHGIRGALVLDEPPGPVSDAERRAAAGRASAASRSGASPGRAAAGPDPTRTTGVLRSRTALKTARPAARTPDVVRGSRAPRPPTRLSESGLNALRAELRELTEVIRPAIVRRIAAARELGDLRENSEYHEARREHSFAEGRIQAIEELLRNVEIVEEGADEGRARLGSTIVVDGPHGEETFGLVGSAEANAAAGRISASSPIGAALLDRSAGEEVEVASPSGRVRYRIIEVR